MARINGGIFSRPSGHNNGLVFGKGRTRQGKVTTIREYVIPANPRTPKQQIQRNKFSQSIAITRLLGKEVYKDAFDSTVGKLSGFNSLLSIILNNMYEDGTTLRPPETTVCGTLFPVPIIDAYASNGQPVVNWEGTRSGDSDDFDKMVVFYIENGFEGAPYDRYVHVYTEALRGDETAQPTLPNFFSMNMIIGLFAISANPNLQGKDRFSPCQWIDFEM